MSGYAFHPDARGDLDEIWDYIAADDLDAAGATISARMSASVTVEEVLTARS
jgi:plasmid stabilization system protein ParE